MSQAEEAVEHRDVWRDTLLLDQTVQHRSCPVSGIGHGSGLRPKRPSVLSIMVFAAPTSAWRMAGTPQRQR
jgi:hypothetical protein